MIYKSLKISSLQTQYEKFLEFWRKSVNSKLLKSLLFPMSVHPVFEIPNLQKFDYPTSQNLTNFVHRKSEKNEAFSTFSSINVFSRELRCSVSFHWIFVFWYSWPLRIFKLQILGFKFVCLFNNFNKMSHFLREYQHFKICMKCLLSDLTESDKSCSLP